MATESAVPISSAAVGWDETIAKPVNPTPTSKNNKQFDANDYSRFNKITDMDGEDGKECSNCHKIAAKLKCSVCKKSVYCNQSCQKSDWIYHKRICTKPVEKKPTVPEPKPTKKPSLDSNKKTSNGGVVKVTSDELNLKDVRGYKNGVPYFHRELSVEEKALIGDIAPKKLSETKNNFQCRQDTPSHEGSAWNSAGTFEEKDLSTWAKRKIEDAFVPLELLLDEDLSLNVTDVKDISGDANIFVVRGKKRYVYDLKFSVEWKVAAEQGVKTFTGKTTFAEVSNDSEYETKTKWITKPSSDLLEAIEPKLFGKKSELHVCFMNRIEKFIEDFQSQ